MDLIVLHEAQELSIFYIHHLVERQRPIPFVRAKVEYQCDDRREPVVFIEPREVFAPAVGL